MEFAWFHDSGTEAAPQAPSEVSLTRSAFHELSVNQDEARQQYCKLIGSLVAAEGGDSARVTTQAAASSSSYETLLVSREDNITCITLNRPAKKNAITNQVWGWTKILFLLPK